MADAIAQKYNASKSQVLDHVSWVIDGRSLSYLFPHVQGLPGLFMQQKPVCINKQHVGQESSDAVASLWDLSLKIPLSLEDNVTL